LSSDVDRLMMLLRNCWWQTVTANSGCCYVLQSMGMERVCNPSFRLTHLPSTGTFLGVWVTVSPLPR